MVLPIRYLTSGDRIMVVNLPSFIRMPISLDFLQTVLESFILPLQHRELDLHRSLIVNLKTRDWTAWLERPLQKVLSNTTVFHS